MKVLKTENLKDWIFFLCTIIIYNIYLLMNTNRRIFILFDSGITYDCCCMSVFNKSSLFSFSSINIVDGPVRFSKFTHKRLLFLFLVFLYFKKEYYFGFNPLLEMNSKECYGINLISYLSI